MTYRSFRLIRNLKLEVSEKLPQG